MQDQIFYESSNGDVWSLTVGPTGGSSVKHIPNAKSGGKASFIDVADFLAERPDGPQHQALRDLMQTRPSA